ncbi:hypothetical protein FO519_002067 [Halicephalobus sp. NKZ332]|nr:hypothetical protein FO519_002067 [Halicephalobus sp. NKZ332]
MNTDLSRLKLLLSCKKKNDCPRNCCGIAVEALEKESIPSVRLVATQILSLHEFQFSEDQLSKKNLLLAFLQIEEPRKTLDFLEKKDHDLLVQFNINELDLVLSRLRKIFDAVHPGLTWMLKIKYQALAVLVTQLPTEFLVDSFSDISLQLKSALNLQEISSVTSDLILAYCLRFEGFWYPNHEFHEIYRFLVTMIFNSNFITRSRTRALWIPRFLACCELKGFFLKLKEDCQSGAVNLLVPIKMEPEPAWSVQEQSAYGLLLTNKLLNSGFDEGLKKLCLDWALYARNQEICKLAVDFMKSHLKEFDIPAIAKTVLINFDSGDPDLVFHLLAIFKLTEFPEMFYDTLFRWMHPDQNLFYLRKSFLVSAFEHFPKTFFEDKRKIFDFLETACKSAKYGNKEIVVMHRGLVKIYGNELQNFWKEKTVNSRKSELENLELFLEYSKVYDLNLDGVCRTSDVSNETILETFGSHRLGESIPVTAVVSRFTNEKVDENSVKLNAYAVAKEKSEFVNPLILNCRKLSLTPCCDFVDVKAAARSIAEVILRVKHKKIIDHVSGYFSSFMVKLKENLDERKFSELWEELYSIVKLFYIDEDLDCRSLAAWRILLVLLEAVPMKLNEVMRVLLEAWRNSECQTLVIRAGKAIKALISTSFLDTTKYYSEILRNCFGKAEGIFSVASNMGQITATIAVRIFPQDPTLTPVSWFSKKYPELFDTVVELFTTNPSHRGCLQIVGFLQKLIVVRKICYGQKLRLQLESLVRSMRIMCLSQFTVMDERLEESQVKPLVKLELFSRRLRANSLINMIESRIEGDIKDDGGVDGANSVVGQLRYIISTAKSNSIKKRQKGVQFILENSNLNRFLKLIGLILFSEDEVDNVLAVYRKNGFIVKPIEVLLEFIERERFTQEQLVTALKTVEEAVPRYYINQAADDICADRILLLKSKSIC